jgi:hypothetical protein
MDGMLISVVNGQCALRAVVVKAYVTEQRDIPLALTKVHVMAVRERLALAQYDYAYLNG